MQEQLAKIEKNLPTEWLLSMRYIISNGFYEEIELREQYETNRSALDQIGGAGGALGLSNFFSGRSGSQVIEEEKKSGGGGNKSVKRDKL